jgi:uncharacterized protein YabN with tetrapyrrole methylase and pyrophosphatase domain
MPSEPTPVYLVLLALAFRRSVRMRSTSPSSSTISFARLRTAWDKVSRKVVTTKKFISTIDALVFALLIDVVKVPQHLDGTHVTTCVVYDPFRPVLDQVFQQLEGLNAGVSIVEMSEQDRATL